MKIIISILFVIAFLTFQSENFVGEYYNNFGQALKINQDSTFICKWNFHMSGSWTKGKWKTNNDTVYFTITPIFDTLRFSGKKDTLILSINENPELITEKNASISQMLSTYTQNNREMDSKLFYKNGKLFSIDKNGKLITKKQKFMSQKKHNPWFIKKEKKASH
jgi:hypothetical protein